MIEKNGQKWAKMTPKVWLKISDFGFRLQRFQIVKFSDLIYFHNSIFMYQFKYNLLPTAFDNYFESAISLRLSYNTRY
jgi:hypothetical protein